MTTIDYVFYISGIAACSVIGYRSGKLAVHFLWWTMNDGISFYRYAAPRIGHRQAFAKLPSFVWSSAKGWFKDKLNGMTRVG